jgi:hypothetical protein
VVFESIACISFCNFGEQNRKNYNFYSYTGHYIPETLEPLRAALPAGTGAMACGGAERAPGEA